MSDALEIFSRIYKEHEWGGVSRSGPGSDPELLRLYLQQLVAFIKEKKISSVVDIGCGDWALAGKIDWTGIDYTGIDIVPELVNRLNSTFGSDTIRFICADVSNADLPSAELCIIKDVLQHLSNASVHSFLNKLQKQFKYAVITNDIMHKKQAGWRSGWKTARIEANCDIPDGAYRPLQLIEAPFHLRARRLSLIPLRFKRQVFGHSGAVFETKEILLWEHSATDSVLRNRAYERTN
jgi:SAM-dependent methyltransferase